MDLKHARDSILLIRGPTKSKTLAARVADSEHNGMTTFRVRCAGLRVKRNIVYAELAGERVPLFEIDPKLLVLLHKKAPDDADDSNVAQIYVRFKTPVSICGIDATWITLRIVPTSLSSRMTIYHKEYSRVADEGTLDDLKEFLLDQTANAYVDDIAKTLMRMRVISGNGRIAFGAEFFGLTTTMRSAVDAPWLYVLTEPFVSVIDLSLYEGIVVRSATKHMKASLILVGRASNSKTRLMQFNDIDHYAAQNAALAIRRWLGSQHEIDYFCIETVVEITAKMIGRAIKRCEDSLKDSIAQQLGRAYGELTGDHDSEPFDNDVEEPDLLKAIESIICESREESASSGDISFVVDSASSRASDRISERGSLSRAEEILAKREPPQSTSEMHLEEHRQRRRRRRRKRKRDASGSYSYDESSIEEGIRDEAPKLRKRDKRSTATLAMMARAASVSSDSASSYDIAIEQRGRPDNTITPSELGSHSSSVTGDSFVITAGRRMSITSVNSE